MTRMADEEPSLPLRWFWNAYARAYDFIWDSPLTEAIMREATRAVPKAGSRASCAVDLGCGTGLSARALDSRGYDVVGVDSCGCMLSRAVAYGRVSRVVLTDAASSGLADASAGIVCAANVLHLHARPTDVLDEAHRLLVPGGVLLCVWPADTLTLGYLLSADMRAGRGAASALAAAACRLAFGVMGAPLGARRQVSEEVRACVGTWALGRGYRVIDQGVAERVSEYAVMRKVDVDANST